jgi:dTDP-4-dehydrorhamnose reductase
VLLIGSRGQLGKSLSVTVAPELELLALDQDELDITDSAAVKATCTDFRPATVVNASAYTAVDQAESEPHKAYAVNRDGSRHLAEAASSVGARLIHVSTDFVFDGTHGSPYTPAALTGPLQVYGASKLAGEQAVKTHALPGWLIIRTAWVYAAGAHNFVNTMLRLMSDGKPLRVVADQVGSPTWAKGLAKAIWRAHERGLNGIHHWTDAGVASWYDFAVAIQEEAISAGILDSRVLVEPIRTDDYPTPAKRPAYSVLDKTSTWSALGMTAPHWRDNLRNMIDETRQLSSGETPFQSRR